MNKIKATNNIISALDKLNNQIDVMKTALPEVLELIDDENFEYVSIDYIGHTLEFFPQQISTNICVDFNFALKQVFFSYFQQRRHLKEHEAIINKAIERLSNEKYWVRCFCQYKKGILVLRIGTEKENTL